MILLAIPVFSKATRIGPKNMKKIARKALKNVSPDNGENAHDSINLLPVAL